MREKSTACILPPDSPDTAWPPLPGSARNSPDRFAASRTTFRSTASNFRPRPLVFAAATPGRFLLRARGTEFSISSRSLLAACSFSGLQFAEHKIHDGAEKDRGGSPSPRERIARHECDGAHR